jgi:hypothetical protein
LKLRIYLSELVDSYHEYQQQQQQQQEWQPQQFDNAFYDWIIERHKKQIPMNAYDIELARTTFEKAYSIFSCDPSSEMKRCVESMRDTSTRLEASGEYEVPHKVKRIMAKYNFIYI